MYSIIGIMFAMFISIIDYRIYKNTKFLGLVFLVLIAATISVRFLGRDAKGAIVSGIIFFRQNHLSAAVLVMTTLLIQMFIAGINFKALITAMIAGGIGGYFTVTSIFKKASRTDLDRLE